MLWRASEQRGGNSLSEIDHIRVLKHINGGLSSPICRLKLWLLHMGLRVLLVSKKAYIIL